MTDPVDLDRLQFSLPGRGVFLSSLGLSSTVTVPCWTATVLLLECSIIGLVSYPLTMASEALAAQNSHVGSPPWQLGFRSSKIFMVSVVAIAIFTVSSTSTHPKPVDADKM